MMFGILLTITIIFLMFNFLAVMLGAASACDVKGKDLNGVHIFLFFAFFGSFCWYIYLTVMVFSNWEAL